MSDILNRCLTHNFNVDGIKPLLVTSYESCGKITLFANAAIDIKKSLLLTHDDINFCLKIINLLEKSYYPLHRYESIHIVSSQISGVIHFVQINNISVKNIISQNEIDQSDKLIDQSDKLIDVDNQLSTQNDNLDDLSDPPKNVHSKLYIQYRPELFNDTLWSKIINQYFPSNISICDKFANGKHNTNFFAKVDKKPNYKWISSILNSATFLNCAIYITMYWLNKNPNFTQSLTQHPFRNSFNIICDSAVYGSLAVWISSFGSYGCGNIIINSVLFWINYNLYKSIASKTIN